MSIFDPANYTFSYYAIPHFLAGSLVVGLALFAVLRERFSPLVLIFAFFSLTIGWWQLSLAVQYLSNNPATAYFWSRSLLLPIYPAAASSHVFAIIAVQQFHRYRFLICANLLLALVFAWFIARTPWIVAGSYHYSWGYYLKHGSFLPIHILFFSASVIEMIRLFWLGARRATQEREKRRLKAFLFAWCAITLGAVDYFPCFGIPIYTVGCIPALIFVVICFRTIFKYRLVDVTPSFAVKQIIATMGEALVIVDREGVIRVANPSAAALFAPEGGLQTSGDRPPAVLAGGALIGRSFAEVGGDLVTSQDLEGLTRGPLRDREIILSSSSSPAGSGGGSPTGALGDDDRHTDRYLSVSASIVLDKDAQAAAYVILARDITERKHGELELKKAKEAAEEANRAKSAFLAMMSHEIRTPMNAIIGMNGLILEATLPPEIHEYATVARNSGHALLGIINDILDFSKIEAGKMTFEAVDFDVRQPVESAGDLLGVRAQEKGVELVMDIDPEAPEVLRGDPGRLRQVLINLIGNAIKFTERGEVVVRVTKE